MKKYGGVEVSVHLGTRRGTSCQFHAPAALPHSPHCIGDWMGFRAGLDLIDNMILQTEIKKKTWLYTEQVDVAVNL
jgi:hypothetical protein